MSSSLGGAVHRRRRSVLAVAALALAAAVVWGSGVFAHLAGSGFEDPGSESARAQRESDARLPRDDADVVAIYTSPGRTADDPAFRRAVEDALARLPAREVTGADTPWSTGASGLVSTDRRSVAVLLRLRGADEPARKVTYRAVEGPLTHPQADVRVEVGGSVPVSIDISRRVERDIVRAETVTLPALLLLLVLLIGGVLAAGVPVLVGALVITGGLVVLRALTAVTDVSVFAVNVVTMLGLGLAVDYALLVVTRFREELGRGRDVEDAVRVTVATSGRTVVVSGGIIAGTLASLLLFPQVYFRSVGLAGLAVTGLAVLSALTVLPALLAVLGHRVDALRIPLPRWTPPARHGPTPRGFWSRTATAVMRRPVPIVLLTVPLLLVLAIPFLKVDFGNVDYRALPAGTESRVVAEQLVARFPGGGRDPIRVIVEFNGGGADPSGLAVDEYVERLRALPGAESADVTAAAGGTVRIRVQPAYDVQSPQARRLVSDMRLTPPPQGSHVLVGGTAAKLVDLLASLRATLPWMVAALVAVTLVVLLLAFGSLVLPVKAILMSALSLSASFGAVVWIFQDGHLSGLLDFTPSGAVEATQPILMFAIAFGLSTDYEVFLLSRVREEWQRSGDNTHAVATGVQCTAPIVTSAALLLVVVIGAFSWSGISFVKMIGVGLVLTIVLDATVIRALLVPATMRLLGAANWWAPAALARLADRLSPEGRRPGVRSPKPAASPALDPLAGG